MLNQFFSGRNLFILFVALSANFLQPLLPCNTTKHMAESKFLRYFLGFVVMIFFVVVTDTAEIDGILPLGTILTTSAVLYAWFIVASKMTANWWYVLVLLFGGLYLINLYEDRHLYKADRAETFATVKGWLLGSSAVLTVLGCLIYVGERKIKYKGKFNFGEFLFGDPSCKGNTMPVEYLTALKAAFMDVGSSSSGQRGGGGEFQMSGGFQSGGGGVDPFLPPPVTNTSILV